MHFFILSKDQDDDQYAISHNFIYCSSYKYVCHKVLFNFEVTERNT